MNIKICLDIRRAKSDNTFPIVVYVKNRTSFRVSLGMSSYVENWDMDKNKFNKREHNYKLKNIRLKDLEEKIRNRIDYADEDGITITDKFIKELIRDIVSPEEKIKKQKLFVDYFDEFISQKDRKSTRNIYNHTRGKIVEFDKNCTFDTIDHKWLTKFEKWLSSTMMINSCGIHLRNIRAVFNYCITEEYTNVYPFRKFKIKKEVTRKRCLSIEQLRVLRDYKCEEYQEKYRDIFMLMFYLLGINAGDLFLAKKSDVVNGRLEYKRMKTSRLYSIKIEPEAQEIIDRYSGSEKNGYLLNVMDYHSNYKDFLNRMGRELKKIGEMKRVGRGGKKIIQSLYPEISSYWSRHTWATVAASLDIPKEVIAHGLGHSWADSTTTDIYIKFDERKIDKANRKVIDYLFEE